MSIICHTCNLTGCTIHAPPPPTPPSGEVVSVPDDLENEANYILGRALGPLRVIIDRAWSAGRAAGLSECMAIVDREIAKGSIYGMSRIAAMADQLRALKERP